jgi:putative chitinase
MCVSNGGGSGCIDDGRCSCGAGSDCRVYTSGTPGSREKYLVDQAKSNGKGGVELAQFLGQCAHECDSYNTMTEYASGAEYEGRCSDLGNCQPGDGVRYKGRGYIQITGRYNYRTYGGYIGQDLEGNPTLAEQPSIAAQVALQYWNRIVKPKVSNFEDTTAVTILINGGTNGLADRQTKFAQYKAACGVSLGFNETSAIAV